MARYDFQSSLGSGPTRIEDVVSGEDFTSLLTQTVGTLTKAAAAWESGDVFNCGGVVDSFETVLASMVPTSSQQRVFVDMCREAIDNADVKGGVDPLMTTALFTAVMTRVLRSSAAGVSHVTTLQRSMNEVLTCRRHLRSVQRRCSKEDLQTFLSDVNIRHRDLVGEALQLAGADGRISFQTSTVKTHLSTITVQDDYMFDLVSPCMSTVGGSDVSIELPRVLIVDGFIGSVAEIDHVLAAAVEQRQSLVVFARRFDPDVLSTIGHNNRRGTFKVLPVIVPYDADSANVLKDIAVVCNSTVVSSLLGQLVTSVTYESLPTIDFVKAEHDVLRLGNEQTANMVREHVEALQGMLQRDDNGISHTFINRRIRCLSNRLINVRVSDVDSRRVISTDRSIRVINLCLKRGVVRRADISREDLQLWNELSRVIGDRKTFAMDELDQLLLCVGGLVRLLGMSNCLLVH